MSTSEHIHRARELNRVLLGTAAASALILASSQAYAVTLLVAAGGGGGAAAGAAGGNAQLTMAGGDGLGVLAGLGGAPSLGGGGGRFETGGRSGDGGGGGWLHAGEDGIDPSFPIGGGSGYGGQAVSGVASGVYTRSGGGSGGAGYNGGGGGGGFSGGGGGSGKSVLGDAGGGGGSYFNGSGVLTYRQLASEASDAYSSASFGLVIITGASGQHVFHVHGGVPQAYTVAATGTVTVFAEGAQGRGFSYYGLPGQSGGAGAGIGGTFNVTRGDTLFALVGYGGGHSDSRNFGGGGGGGSFVWERFSGGVPEPASWLTLEVGVLGVGFALRRRAARLSPAVDRDMQTA